jgi:hypothetical protein
MTKLPWRRRTSCRGQALVEFALVLSVVVMVLLLAIDLGRVYFAFVGVRNAAREAAIYGGYNPGETCATGLSYKGIGYTISKELQRPYADVVCGSGASNKVIVLTAGATATGCYQFTAPSSYAACPGGLLDPAGTFVYRVGVSTRFQPVTPFVGLLTGNGLGGSVPISVVTSSPVLAGYR